VGPRGVDEVDDAGADGQLGDTAASSPIRRHDAIRAGAQEFGLGIGSVGAGNDEGRG
jgi:hypothetical protein